MRRRCVVRSYHDGIVWKQWAESCDDGVHIAFIRARMVFPTMSFQRYLHDFVALPVHVPSTAFSKSMADNCTAYVEEQSVTATYVDLGLAAKDMHTQFSDKREMAATNAFIDFLLLLDATIIVRTHSSFSRTVSAMKGLACHRMKQNDDISASLTFCVPADC